MADRPTAAELVDAVREWIETELAPTLDGRLAFHARVAVNALAIASRELGAGEPPPALVEEARRLLGEAVDPGGVDAAVARAIRAGALRADDPAVVALVRELVRERLLVANPRYVDVDSGPAAP